MDVPVVEDRALRQQLVAYFRSQARMWAAQADGCLTWDALDAAEKHRARAAVCTQMANDLDQAVLRPDRVPAAWRPLLEQSK